MKHTACSYESADEGFRQDVEFTPTGVFSVTVFPLGEPRAGTVMCGSLFEDMRRNYRREVLLSRRLARSGVVVHRFHYRGTGNSIGEPADMRWEHVLDDAHAAEERLRVQVGEHEPVACFGSGFGSLVAIALSAGRRDIPLVLWDPVLDANTYSRDLRRNALISKLADGSTSDRSDFPAATEALPPALTRRAAELSLSELGAAGVGPVFVSRRGRERPPTATRAVEQALAQHATSIVVRNYSDEPPWWSGAHMTVRSADSKWRLLDDTVTWLRRETQERST